MSSSTGNQGRLISRRLAICAVFAILAAWSPMTAAAGNDQSIDTLRQMGKAFASIAGKASPAVVGVRAEKVVRRSGTYNFGDPSNPYDEDIFRYFFPYRSPGRPYRRPESTQVAQGSGFLITSDGYVLTNNHLVGDAKKVTIRLDNGQKLDAKIIGADADSDVAVVKIEGEGLPHLELANSDALEVGEWVVAIGSPFGLSHTVTAGIVSAKGRSSIGVADYEDFIQTDAAINFGNSGGPLLNLDGEVVGMNTAIIGPGGNVGIGLAIPINMAAAIYEQLKDTGKVERGFLGVGIQDFDPELAEAFGLKDIKGAVVTEVTEDSAAEKAGLRPDDIVVEFEGEPVGSANDFRNRVAMNKPGSRVEMVVLRDGKRRTITAKLGQKPEGTADPRKPSEEQQDIGITVQTLTEDLARQLGYEGQRGVIVTEVEPGSTAQQAGITSGALITEVNRKAISSVKEFNEELARARKEGKVLLKVKDKDFTRFIVVPIPSD